MTSREWFIITVVEVPTIVLFVPVFVMVTVTFCVDRDGSRDENAPLMYNFNIGYSFSTPLTLMAETKKK